jgi:hypothetical protein
MQPGQATREFSHVSGGPPWLVLWVFRKNMSREDESISTRSWNHYRGTLSSAPDSFGRLQSSLPDQALDVVKNEHTPFFRYHTALCDAH